MTLQEALKSGRNFRRRAARMAGDSIWLSPTYNDFDRDDVLADDWEIEEPTVTITRSQLNAAVHYAVQYQRTFQNPYKAVEDILAEMLGLVDAGASTGAVETD
jgi:hypothetical protein